MSLWWVIQAVSLPICAIAAITDYRTGRIPNWLTLPGLAITPLIHGLLGGLSAFGFSLFGAAACALVPYILFRQRACGGGDVKLFALLGAIGGATFGVEAQLFSFTLATLFVLARMIWDGQALRFLGQSLRVVTNPLLPRRFQREVDARMLTPIRLGLPILGGVSLALLARAPFLMW
jgi:prepilin peptidase CpaA